MPGDAAGSVDPWLREGISFALRSGRLAARSATAVAGATTASAVRTAERDYAQAVDRELGVEMDTSRQLARIISSHPAFVPTALIGLPPLWRRVDDYITGRKSIPDVVNHPLVRPVISGIAALS